MLHHPKYSPKVHFKSHFFAIVSSVCADNYHIPMSRYVDERKKRTHKNNTLSRSPEKCRLGGVNAIFWQTKYIADIPTERPFDIVDEFLSIHLSTSINET